MDVPTSCSLPKRGATTPSLCSLGSRSSFTNCIDFPYMLSSNMTSSSSRQNKCTDTPLQYCASMKRIDMHSSFNSLSSTRSGDKTRSSVFSGSLSRLDVPDPGKIESDSPSSLCEEVSYHYTSIALPSFAFDTQSDTLSLLSSETCSGAECLSHPHTISVQSGDVKSESQLLYRGRFHGEVSVHSPKVPSHLSSMPLHSVSSPSSSVLSSSTHCPSASQSSSPSTQSSSPSTQPRADIKCKKPANKWTKEEDALLHQAVSQYGDCNWKYIAFRRCGEVV